MYVSINDIIIKKNQESFKKKFNIKIIMSFSDLKITTITLDIILDGEILDLMEVYTIIPTLRIENHDPDKFYVKLIEIPHSPKDAGTIVGSKHLDKSKGIKRSKKRNFNNCVSLDVQTAIKNVNIKLSKRGIHLVGAASHRDGIRASLYVTRHLNYAQSILDKINYNEITTYQIAQTLLFIKKFLKGNPIKIYQLINKFKTKSGKNVNMFDDEYQIKHLLIKDFFFDDLSLPGGVCGEFLDFLIIHMSDFDYYEDYCEHVDDILKIKQIISNPISIIKSEIVMMNYNFKLGFFVDRLQLKLCIRELGFYVHYDPTSSYAVSVHIPYHKNEILSDDELNSEEYNFSYENEEEYDFSSEEENESEIMNPKEKKTNKKLKAKKITFLVYKEGSVTLSGPGGDIMHQAYNMFMNAIKIMRPRIEFFMPDRN